MTSKITALSLLALLCGCADRSDNSGALGIALLGYSSYAGGYAEAYNAYPVQQQTYCFPVGYYGAVNCSTY